MSAMKRIQPLAMLLLGMVILASAASALTAGNTVPASRLDEYANAITANALKPVECSAITLKAIIFCPVGGGICDGTDASELVIGSTLDDDIRSGKGDDCVLGGDGNDRLKGEQNTDVCIGGPGADGFNPTCESQFQ